MKMAHTAEALLLAFLESDVATRPGQVRAADNLVAEMAERGSNEFAEIAPKA